jgi:hypothetical protein
MRRGTARRDGDSEQTDSDLLQTAPRLGEPAGIDGVNPVFSTASVLEFFVRLQFPART